MKREINRLVRKARGYWERNEHLPLDLFAELVGLGVDVETLEQRYLRYE